MELSPSQEHSEEGVGGCLFSPNRTPSCALESSNVAHHPLGLSPESTAVFERDLMVMTVTPRALEPLLVTPYH